MRTLVTLIKEQQVERDNLWIVGVAANALHQAEDTSHCRMCGMSEPPVADVVIGEGSGSDQEASEPKPSVFDNMSPEERYAAFQKYMENCIDCHACRNACPLCYCETCFVDQSMPEWVSSGADPADKTMFHLGRLMHIAGRCGECGACAEACPMDIPLDEMARYVAEFVKENFDTEGGMNAEEPDALGAFSPNDDDSIFL